MADLDLTEGVRKLFLLGVGAAATGAEKSQEIINELVKKGELTVDQGKALNQELTVKAKAAASDMDGTLLKSKLETMTKEERAAYAAKVAKLAKELDDEVTEVEVETEDAEKTSE